MRGVLVMWLVSASGCGPGGVLGCDLDEVVADVAGDAAEDCGRTAADADPSAVDACVAAAIADGRDAFGVTASSGIDSVITTAKVFVDGRLWLLTQDSFGGPNDDVDGYECVGPTFDEAGALQCTSREPQGNHYLVCGEWNGGDVEPLPFPG